MHACVRACVRTQATNVEVLRDTASIKIYDKEHIQRLQIRLKKILRQCSLLKRKLRQRNKNLKKIFTKDQTNFIKNSTQRGASQSAETINKTLRLYVACGQKGHEELCRQNLPYPNIRTMQHRIHDLKFKPGIFEDIKMLKMKVSTSHE